MKADTIQTVDNKLHDLKRFKIRLRYLIIKLIKSQEIFPKRVISNIKNLERTEDGAWIDNGKTTSPVEELEIWSIQVIPSILERISDQDRKLYKPYLQDIIFSILRKDNKLFLKTLDEHKRVLLKQQLYNIRIYNTIGCSLFSSKFRVIVHNKDSIPIEISFIPTTTKDLVHIQYEDIYNSYRPILADIMYYGLKIQFKIPQCIRKQVIKLDEKEFPIDSDEAEKLFTPECCIAIRILKLFKPSSLSYFSWEYKTEGKPCISPSGAIPQNITAFSSTITQTDSKILQRDYKFFYNKLLRYNTINYNREKQVITPVFVALEKYEEALKIPAIEFEKTLTYIIMGLEAIYTAKNDDLAYALRMRITTLLNLVNLKDEKTLDIIKLAYSIRCDYAHGATNRESLTRKLLKYFNTKRAKYDCLIYFLNILRLSIVTAIILDVGKNISAKENDINTFHKSLDEIMTGDKSTANDIKSKLSKFRAWFYM